MLALILFVVLGFVIGLAVIAALLLLDKFLEGKGLW